MAPAAEALFQQGLAEAKARRYPEAAARFEAVLALDPRHVGALVSLANARLRLGAVGEAEALYLRALAIAPGQPLALRNLCVLLNDQERHAEALALADAALAAEPGFVQGLIARGNALAGLSRRDEAMACFQAAADAAPASAEAQARLGIAQADRGRYEAALRSLDTAVRLDPAEPLARYRRGVVKLQLRRFEAGWSDYEARLALAAEGTQPTGLISPALLPHLTPVKEASELRGRRVLVIGEQGIGDQVMFASILPDLIATAAAVTCVVDARLVRLFADAFPAARVLAPATARVSPSEVDAVVALGSLGRLFRDRAEAFPGRPYLSPRRDVVAAWTERLGPRPSGLRIGVAWRGGTATTRRALRSLPLAALAPIFALPDCELVSLQHGEVAEEVAAAGLPLRLFPPEATHDFEDLAGLIANLDAVVSVQTSLVHLCGALGADCLALIARHPEWRYGVEGETLPWYASVRIQRQGDDEAWGPVVERAAAELRRRL